MPGLPGPEAGEAGGGEEGLCLPGGKVSRDDIKGDRGFFANL